MNHNDTSIPSHELRRLRERDQRQAAAADAADRPPPLTPAERQAIEDQALADFDREWAQLQAILQDGHPIVAPQSEHQRQAQNN